MAGVRCRTPEGAAQSACVADGDGDGLGDFLLLRVVREGVGEAVGDGSSYVACSPSGSGSGEAGCGSYV